LRRDQINGFASFLSGVMFNGSEQDVADYVKKCKAPTLAVSASPKVWVGAGNCLLGDIKKSRNTMAVTALSAGGFNQLVGYTVTTWFGRMGWGTLGRFHSAQHMTLAEAFFMSNQSLLEESERQYPGLLKMEVNPDDNFFKIMKTSKFAAQGKSVGIKKFEKESLGLLHDRDCVAFYGDPRWEARMPGETAISIKSKPIKGGIELQIATTAKFEAGSGFTALFPVSIKDPNLSGGDGWDFLLTDDFMLVKSSDIKPDTVRKIRIISGAEK
jgi:zinc protease